MRQSIGEISTLNIIIIFIVIVFGLLSATINYYKAYKLNSRILDTIEKYEGYNKFAKEAIENDLNTMGYTKISGNWSCSAKNGEFELVKPNNGNAEQGTSHYYCVYYQPDDRGVVDKKITNKDGNPIYYNYIVVTYIFVDLPIVGDFKIPVRTKGERIYSFSPSGNPVTK